jgi:hypothetical protein
MWCGGWCGCSPAQAQRVGTSCPSSWKRGGEGGASGASYLDRELALREVHLVLLGLLQLSRRVGGRQASADRAGLLGSKIQRSVLLVLVEQAELSSLLQVDHGEHASDRLAEIVTVVRDMVSEQSSR